MLSLPVFFLCLHVDFHKVFILLRWKIQYTLLRWNVWVTALGIGGESHRPSRRTNYLYLGGAVSQTLCQQRTGSPGLPVSQYFNVKKERGKRNLGWGGWILQVIYLQREWLRLREYCKFKNACRWVFTFNNHTAVIYFHIYLRFWDLYMWDNTSAKAAIRFAGRLRGSWQ